MLRQVITGVRQKRQRLLRCIVLSIPMTVTAGCSAVSLSNLSLSSLVTPGTEAAAASPTITNRSAPRSVSLRDSASDSQTEFRIASTASFNTLSAESLATAHRAAAEQAARERDLAAVAAARAAATDTLRESISVPSDQPSKDATTTNASGPFGTLTQLNEGTEQVAHQTPANHVIVGEVVIETIDAQSVDSATLGQSIDLASALAMSGGNALTVQLARQKTVEAHAAYIGAKSLWLPTLQAGLGWNKHDGQIQATDGSVIQTTRNSLYYGAGATSGTAPVAGGSGGPLRLTADLALADAYFAPKISNRRLQAQRLGVSVARNQALLTAGIAYVDMLEATSHVADAKAALDSIGQLVLITEAFESAGAGASADVERARVASVGLVQELEDATRRSRVSSAELARALRLDPRLHLQPADQMLLPISLIDNMDIDLHLATATSMRPEFSQLANHIAADCLVVRQQQVDPWLPKITMAGSFGSFGGGVGGNYDNVDGRSDLDLQAVWELENLGYGVTARRQKARSRLSQDQTRLAALRDNVTAQVVKAFEDVRSYASQVQTAEQAVTIAESSYQKNLQRVRAGEGLPIELLQAIRAKADGFRRRTQAVSDHNRAQIQLMYATGQLSQ